ncbi:MAG TPA: hypothetical protein VKX17_26745 [Planctomycetota bacterium]|nr:hypothetical protein [Planctomycetota bacterium]
MAGWKPGLNKVALTKAIRQQCECSLSDAKSKTDRLLDGETVEFAFESELKARQFAHDAETFGVKRAAFSTLQVPVSAAI